MQERIPKCVYELTLTITDEQVLGFVRAILGSLKFSQDQWTEEGLGSVSVVKVFSQDKEKLKHVRLVFAQLKFKALTMRWKSLRPKDWLTVWKKGWKPSALTKTIDVVPIWYKGKYKPQGRSFILMDTLLSFGTGLHETTQMVAQYIEDCSGKFKTFLDIGTGTGILALVALKNSAVSVKAIDIGSLSVEAAKHNFSVNKAKGTILKRDIRTYKDARTYDFVAANLITEDLIEHRKKICSLVATGGFLAISGISLENLPKLRKSFKDMPLKQLKLNKGQQWAGLLYQKTML